MSRNSLKEGSFLRHKQLLPVQWALLPLLCFLLVSLFAETLPEDDSMHWLNRLEQLYLSGNWTEMKSVLEENEPSNRIERTGHNFYRAKISFEREEMVSLLEEAVRLSPDIMFGQRALTKLANISMLERDYQQSVNYLQRIKPQMITQRDYLLSSAYLKLEMYPESIRAAQDFIKITKDTQKRELAYLQIVEAYILNSQYQQALMTLETMKSQEYAINHHAIIDFKEAYCLEKLFKHNEAIEKYKLVITRYPYSEPAFRAERRLYDLTLSQNDKIDYASISIINTHTEPRDRTEVATSPDTPAGRGDDYYVQVNAFSDRSNAVSHSEYLQSFGYENIVFSKTVIDQQLYVVAVGPFSSRNDARTKQTEIKNRLNMDSFIIKY